MWKFKTPGIPDEEFERAEKVPITKEEVRVIQLSKARLKPGQIVYDIGCGSGSISIEAALQIESSGKVLAVDYDKNAIELTKKNIAIINPIDTHLLSSPSISSKMKVAAVPAIIAKATRIQNNLFNFLSFSLFSAILTGGSPDGVSGTGSDFSVSGISTGIFSTDSFLDSLGSIVGSDFFFLNFAK